MVLPMRRFVGGILGLAVWLVPAAAAEAAIDFGKTSLAAGGTVSSFDIGNVDGKRGPDVVSSLYEGAVSVRLNRGNGTFRAPKKYPTGCPTYQVELGDVTSNGTDLKQDGKLDATVLCEANSGDFKYMGRFRGKGNGTFGPMVPTTSLSPGAFWINGQPQNFTLARMRKSGPPVLILPRAGSILGPPPYYIRQYYNELCASYDWATADCLSVPGGKYPSVGPPIISRDVNGGGLEEVITAGGAKGVAVFGVESGKWAWSTRDFGPVPKGTEFTDIATGDLGSDGHPDIITTASQTGAVPGDSRVGRVSILPGNANGVPNQKAKTFKSAAGVISVAVGDFNRDGKRDLIGYSWTYKGTAKAAAFVQIGNGADKLGAPKFVPLVTTDQYSRAPIRVADLDSNGSPDAVAVAGGELQILRNQVESLFRMLGSIEGFRHAQKPLRLGDPAVTHVHDGERAPMNRSTAGLPVATRSPLGDDDVALPGAATQLEANIGDPTQLLHPLADAVGSTEPESGGIGHLRRLVELAVLDERCDHGIGITAVEGCEHAPDDLHVLVRHRIRSIPRLSRVECSTGNEPSIGSTCLSRAEAADLHAIRITFDVTRNAWVHPALHCAGSTSSRNAPSMGMRMRLRPDYGIGRFSGAAR